jgi:hypothetical protein
VQPGDLIRATTECDWDDLGKGTVLVAFEKEGGSRRERTSASLAAAT